MRTHQHAPGQRSSRRFLTAVVVAAALTLSASAPVGAQTVGSRGRGRPQRSSQKRGEVRSGAQPEGFALREHIPPILMADGSLTVEAGRFDVKQASGNPRRPYRYRRSMMNDLYRVVVVAFTEDGIPHYYAWDTPGGGWRVKIWMEREISPGTGAYVSVDPTHPTEPQILVKDMHEIDIDKEMLDNADCQVIVNGTRECSYQHPGYGGAHFRIRHVEVQRGSSTPDYPVWPLRKNKVMILFYYRHPH